MTEEIKCNFQQNYNVFGLDDKPCCYLFHKYCDEIKDCEHKKLLRLEQENKELSFAIEKCLENAGIECDDEEQALRSLPDLGASHYKVLQENKELKRQKRELGNVAQGFIKDIDKERLIAKKYRSVLEEIKDYISDNDNYFTEDIIKIITEVLQ